MLILLPSALQPQPDRNRFAPLWLEALQTLDGLVVENLRASRRFVRAIDPNYDIDSRLWIAQEADGSYDLPAIREAWAQGKKLGLLSDAGYPAVGDPGAEVVAAAHASGVRVQVLPGSCSFLMALSASGLGGQHFAFRGYVPIDAQERTRTLKAWEQESRRSGQTQICMDTPYRNGALWKALLESLDGHTRLCYAIDLEGEHERIRMDSVSNWKKVTSLEWPKLPAVFIFAAKK